MKDKQTACFLLLLVIGGLIFGAQRSYKRMTAARDEAQTQKQSAMQQQQTYNTAKVALDSIKSKTKGVRDFHDAWEPYFRSTSSPQTTEQRVIDLVKRAEVFALSQRFELVKRTTHPVFGYILRAHVTVQDEYSKAFNWLASLEEEMPTSRIISYKLTHGETGDDVRMELMIDLPIIKS